MVQLGPQLTWTFTAMPTKCLTCGTARALHVCGNVEKQDKFASKFWSEMNQQVVEHVTLTYIPSKLHDTWSLSGT